MKQLTIGETIAALKEAQYNRDAWIEYDFGGFVPYHAKSYRGFYDQLAIGFGPSTPQTEWEKRTICKTPAALIAELEQSVGRTYEGYKGGEYTMRADTPLWVANTGEAPGTGVVGVRSLNYMLIINTAYIDADEVTYGRDEMIKNALKAVFGV